MTKAQVEVITSVERRRWSRSEKKRIVTAAIVLLSGENKGPGRGQRDSRSVLLRKSCTLLLKDCQGSPAIRPAARASSMPCQ